MKKPYIPPKTEVTVFAPVERIMELRSIDPQDAATFDLRALTNLSGSAGNPTDPESGDIFLPV